MNDKLREEKLFRVPIGEEVDENGVPLAEAIVKRSSAEAFLRERAEEKKKNAKKKEDQTIPLLPENN